MSYLKCISNALRDGEMTSDAADAHRIEYDKQFKKFKDQGMTDVEAERMAAKETWDVKLQERIEKKRQALLRKLKSNKTLDDQQEAEKEKKEWEQKLLALYSKDSKEDKSTETEKEEENK